MAKKVDITEKLNFDTNPVLVIKETEIEVNTDAETVLKIMGILSENESESPKVILEMYDLIFSTDAKNALGKLKLSFTDLTTVVKVALNLITGEEDEVTRE